MQAYFSNLTNPLSETENKLNLKIDALKENTLEIIRKAMARNEIIDDVLDGATELEKFTIDFHDSSKKVKSKYWWENAKCWIFIGVGVIVVVIALLLIICNPNFSKC